MEVVTFGYGGFLHEDKHGLNRMDLLMEDDKTYLVDVRFSPWANSKFPEWHGKNLLERYGAYSSKKGGYVHIPELGNLNYEKKNQHKGFTLQDAEAGIKRLVAALSRGYRLVLLCGCRDYGYCHRSLVTQLLLAEYELGEVLVTHIIAKPKKEKEVMPLITITSSPAPVVPTMKALSIRQPWCYLIGSRFKDVENRDWSTKYRGPVLLHAGTKIDGDWFDYGKMSYRLMSRYGINDYGVPENKADYPTQAIIGVAEMVGCVEESDSRWFCGEYGFVFSHASLFKNPIPYKGQLNFFDVPLSVVAAELALIGKPEPEVHTPIVKPEKTVKLILTDEPIDQPELFATPALYKHFDR